MKKLTDIKQALLDYEQAKPDWLQTGCSAFSMYAYDDGSVTLFFDCMTMNDENKFYDFIYQKIENLAYDDRGELSAKIKRKEELMEELTQLNEELGL